MTDVVFDNGVARVVLDAPPLNILTRAVLQRLRDQIAAVRADASVRVLLLTASGRHFSAGASVEEHLPPDFTPMIREFGETIVALQEFPLPVIAAVQGRCLGAGFELVQAADIVIAAQSAQFGQPEIALGVIAPMACVLLPERIGRVRAAHALFTGETISAADAVAYGLALRTVPDVDLQVNADELARRIARHSASALRFTKRALRGRGGDSLKVGIGEAGSLYTDELMKSADALEGLHAFLEKRKPEWSHR